MLNTTLVKILATSISSRATVTKVNEMKLDRGSSFIGFLWRVRSAVLPWDSLSILGSICWLLVLLGQEHSPLGLVFSYFHMLVCWFFLSLCWRVVMACFSTLHYRPLMTSALLAGSSLGRLGDTSVHVNPHWFVTNICIASN